MKRLPWVVVIGSDEADRNQSSAEVDALRLLWGGTMKQFTPEARRFETWLRLIGYAEMTRNINTVHRQFIRREGMMLPGQLIRCMDNLVTQTLLSHQRSSATPRKEVRKY